MVDLGAAVLDRSGEGRGGVRGLKVVVAEE